MQLLEVSGAVVLYIGRTMSKGERVIFLSCASYPPLWQVSIEIHSHVFVVVSRRAVLLKDVIITVFIQLWHRPVASFWNSAETVAAQSQRTRFLIFPKRRMTAYVYRTPYCSYCLLAANQSN
jgi:hypothetical protein